MKHRIYIGIDTGVNTGLAVWDSVARQFINLETVAIHVAMEEVKRWHGNIYGTLLVRVEDARQRKWYGATGKEKAQGAGSIKRDAKIWEDFLTDLGCEFMMVAPKDSKTKLSAVQFVHYTGWRGKTNEHMRDAAMLVWGI